VSVPTTPRVVLAAALTLALGLSARAALSGWVAKYAGVALWATLLYFLIVLVARRLAWPAALAICVGLSFAVELFQLTPVPLRLSRISPLFALVLGTTYSSADLPAYVVGAALGALAHRAGALGGSVG